MAFPTLTDDRKRTPNAQQRFGVMAGAVLRMTVSRNFEVYGFVRKFCAKNPPLRQAAKRCASAYNDNENERKRF